MSGAAKIAAKPIPNERANAAREIAVRNIDVLPDVFWSRLRRTALRTPLAQIHSLRAVRFLFFRRGAAIEMNTIHLKRDHQITSARFKCPRRNASWKKSSRLRKTFRR